MSQVTEQRKKRGFRVENVKSCDKNSKRSSRRIELQFICNQVNKLEFLHSQDISSNIWNITATLK
jgi:hypothetical protein